MHGPITKLKSHLGLIPKKTKRGNKKKKKGSGSVYRDYRGVEGALEDAQKGKKK